MVFQGTGLPHRVDTLSSPVALRRGDLLVAVRLATICGSDLHTYAGRRSCPLPTVLGHEAVGTVVALGEGRDPALMGRRVTWTLADSCGKCVACAEWSLPQKCQTLFKYGHAALEERAGLNGCFASHFVLREGTTVFPLPDCLPDTVVAPVNCALATMVAVTEALTESHQTVLIQGAGLLGVYGAALLQQRGKRVLIADIDAERLALAARFGAEPVRDLAADSVDAAIEVAGTAAVIPEALRALRPGGLYAMAGMVHPEGELRMRGEELIRGCLTIQGFHNYAPCHLESGIRFLEAHRGAYPWDTLVSDAIPLEDLDTAFELAVTRRWHRVAISSQTNASQTM